MKKLFVFISFLSSLQANAQEAKPELLKEPANWEFEKFPLPPGFAPGIRYKGVEELRFSPGMFKKDSADYFTYAFVAELDSVTAISQAQVQDYLLQYFRGLCSVVAKDRKLTIDSTKIAAEVKRKKGRQGGHIVYNCTLNVFGVFQDGAPVKLNAEVKVVTGMAAGKTWLVFIASPLEKKAPVWKELYRIQKEFIIPE